MAEIWRQNEKKIIWRLYSSRENQTQEHIVFFIDPFSTSLLAEIWRQNEKKNMETIAIVQEKIKPRKMLFF